MDTQTFEQTKQIIESIKTLNLNLNDATTQKLADIVLPIAQQIMVYKYIENVYEWTWMDNFWERF